MGAKFTMQDSVTANADGTEVNVQRMSWAAVQMKGTNFEGSVTFEARVDSNYAWKAVAGWDTADMDTKASAFGNPSSEIYIVPLRCLNEFRTRVHDYSAGTIDVVAQFESAGF